MVAPLPRRALLCLAGAFGTATGAAAALPPADAPPAAESFAGKLLVAAPTIGDPLFARAVIVVAVHNAQGALGVTINRLVGERPLAEVLAAVGVPAHGVTGTIRVFAGGPVEPTIGFVLHSTDYHQPETLTIDANLALTSSPAILRDIAARKGPKKTLVAFGYAGWAPGQLEAEVMQRAWIIVPEDPTLVFDDDRSAVWADARARHTLPL